MKIAMSICIIVLLGLFFLDEIHKAPSPLPHETNIRKVYLPYGRNDIRILNEAINIASYMSYPIKDSFKITLIVGDNSAVITKYPDSLMKIIIRPVLMEQSYLFKNEKPVK